MSAYILKQKSFNAYLEQNPKYKPYLLYEEKFNKNETLKKKCGI